MELAGWYYLRGDGERFGPLKTAELRRLLETGSLPREALVWAEGMADWVPAGDVSTLRTDPYANRAIWSLVLGLVSVFGLFVPVMFVAAVAGLIAGIPARRSTTRRGLAIAGICLSSLGLIAVSVLAWLLFDVAQHVGWQEFLRSMQE